MSICPSVLLSVAGGEPSGCLSHGCRTTRQARTVMTGRACLCMQHDSLKGQRGSRAKLHWLLPVEITDDVNLDHSVHVYQFAPTNNISTRQKQMTTESVS